MPAARKDSHQSGVAPYSAIGLISINYLLGSRIGWTSERNRVQANSWQEASDDLITFCTIQPERFQYFAGI